jgi:NAD(P)-dependent dehydrogenase (short-subunit alcohol dehydrogenase family)
MNSEYRSLFDLSGKTALITGGLGILGRHFARGLAEFGASVAVADLDEGSCRSFAQEISREYGTRAEGFGCDVSLAEMVAGTVDAVSLHFGSIDILLNNAATKSKSLEAFFAPFEEFTIEEWRDVMSVNLDGMFLMAQAVGAVMRRAGRGGSIIQTASIYGILAADPRIYEGSSYMGRPICNPAVYSASKAGVIGLTRHLSTLWAKDGIRVNALTPGGVESGQNDVFQRKYSDRVPLGRMARAPEMVGPVVFLASEASSYITGQNIVVDGGLSAW